MPKFMDMGEFEKDMVAANSIKKVLMTLAQMIGKSANDPAATAN